MQATELCHNQLSDNGREDPSQIMSINIPMSDKRKFRSAECLRYDSDSVYKDDSFMDYKKVNLPMQTTFDQINDCNSKIDHNPMANEKGKYSIYQAFRNHNWIQNKYNSMIDRLKKSTTIRTLMQSTANARRHTSVRKHSNLAQSKTFNFGSIKCFGRSVAISVDDRNNILYAELVTCFAEGKLVLMKCLKSPQLIPGQYIDMLDKNLILGQNVIIRYEKALRSSFGACHLQDQIFSNELDDAAHQLRSIITDINQILKERGGCNNSLSDNLSEEHNENTYNKLSRLRTLEKLGDNNSNDDKRLSNLEMGNKTILVSDADYLKQTSSYHWCSSNINKKKLQDDENEVISPVYDCVYEDITSVNLNCQNKTSLSSCSNVSNRNSKLLKIIPFQLKRPGRKAPMDMENDGYTRSSEELPYSSTTFVVPSTVISLERFTTNMYIVPDLQDERILVVFGSSLVNTIKIYAINGNDMGEFNLNFNWDQNNAYRVENIGYVKHDIAESEKPEEQDNNENLSRKKEIVVNELKGFLISEGIYALKQRLLFFDADTGDLCKIGKRLIEVVNPLECVEIDDNGELYVFDTVTLMSPNRWAKGVDKINKISVGRQIIACLSNDQVIICNKNGHQKYSWAVKSKSVSAIKTVCIQVHNDNRVYVLAWATDTWPPNNILLKFDEEGRIIHEFYLPNKITESDNGKYEFDCGARNQSVVWPFPTPGNYHSAINRNWNRNFGGFTMLALGPQIATADDRKHPHDVWAATDMPMYPVNNNHLFDNSWFYATWFAITHRGNAIVTNITYDQPINYASKKIIVVSVNE
ncbi:hypothetical protein GJ496_010095 [Pomphorhynchus laevis]|nr:hypothetical protein GJ496_010095 [Pomphorhynchus laevis]